MSISQEQMIRDVSTLLCARWKMPLDELCSTSATFLSKGTHNVYAHYRGALYVALRSIKLAGKPRWSFPDIQRALFGVGQHSTVVTGERVFRYQHPQCIIDTLEREAAEVWQQYSPSGNQQHKQAG